MAKSTKIHEQDQALSVYFKDMLGDPVSAEPTPAPVITESIATPPEITETTVTTPVVEPDVEAQTDIDEVADELDLTGDIKLLLCQIAGMEIAVPVDSLNNIVRWPDKALTKIPGKAPWFLGIYSHMGVHTEVIDVTHLLQPDKTEDIAAEAAYILLVDEHKWGIACDNIRQIVTLPKSSINWRRGSQTRPWFSGIVNDKMSSILEIDALLTAFQNQTTGIKPA